MALPEDDGDGKLRDEMVAPIFCGGVTVYKALKLCGAVSGSWIVISGARGGVGALGIQYAISTGYRVLAVDGGVEKGEYVGAEVYVDFQKEGDVLAAVIAATGGKGAAAALAVAGSGRVYRQCFEMMAPFGTIVCVGITPPTDLVQFHPLELIDLGIKLIGSIVGTREDVLEALEFVKRGRVNPVVQSTQLEHLNEIGLEFSKGTVRNPLKAPDGSSLLTVLLANT